VINIAGSARHRPGRRQPGATVGTHTGALPGPPDPTQVDSWLQINSDNSVTLYHGWVELGQGTPTAVRMIAAEELGLSVDQVTAAQVDTNVSLSAFTVGSEFSRPSPTASGAARESGCCAASFPREIASVALDADFNASP
jgi:CO/xanthine dehydrogenase Mo-binding subunit